MRLLFSCVLVLITFFTYAQAVENYTSSIEQERKEKLKMLQSKNESPLLKKDRKKLKELRFYPIDVYAQVDARFFMLEGGDTIDFSTSNGAVKKFKKYGYFVFAYRGKIDTLFAFERVYAEDVDPKPEPYLFVPFKDETSGFKTYGGGRYLDTEYYTEEQNVKLDFNKCYNPYCAYGDGFSCPIPPIENFVNNKIEAGEKKIVGH